MFFEPFRFEIGYWFRTLWSKIGYSLCTLVKNWIWFLLGEANFESIFKHFIKLNSSSVENWGFIIKRREFKLFSNVHANLSSSWVGSSLNYLGWGKLHILVWNSVMVSRNAARTPTRIFRRYHPPSGWYQSGWNDDKHEKIFINRSQIVFSGDTIPLPGDISQVGMTINAKRFS